MTFSKPNYIPHQTPFRVKFMDWFKYYKKDLINLYTIFQDSINDNFIEEDIKSNMKSNVEFTKFVYMIYNSSSKYYPKYY
jgi:hypothetical protein